MQNPYQAPESDLDSTRITYSPSVGWKIAFFILLPLELYSQYTVFTDGSTGIPFWWLVVSLTVSSLFYVVLFGLAFGKRIGFEQLWIFFIPVIVLIDIFEFSLLAINLNKLGADVVLVMATSAPVILLRWYVVYKYQKVMKYFG
ncbi:hypothetical protein ACJJIW_17385 [Microbulbifer sp. JMSA004]|uniref:hypothetical protein n=1 Tax=unclassified Microbulbifer TaxID=2619833 RepID=UPI0024ACBE0F|nr:hypothetical protein [Microbulbifer sp. VAAF005]WHI47189.1 hypothetical protein P0078_02100 [Microbulbifer sp. VAAF005]